LNLLEALRYLAALDQHRHFGRAALACRITQPALSNAIRALETELGVPVVRRSRQYEGLTAEGEVVLAHAHRLLREAEALRQELHSREEAPRGRLQIGAVPTAMTIATRFALRVRDRHGGLAPVVRSLSSQEIETGIENLSLDMGLGYTGRAEVGARALQVWPQYAEAYYVVQRHAADGSGALSVGAPIGWREAAVLPLTLLTPDMHNRTIVDQAFREAGAQVEATLETNSVLALVTALGAGPVAAVLPGALVRSVQSVAGLQARPLVDPVVSTPIGFMTAKSERATPALRAALATAQDAVWLEEAAAHSGSIERAA
jgi:DNA-binding transcriptional LysR family regulator